MLRDLWLSPPSVYLTAMIWLLLLVLVIRDALCPEDDDDWDDADQAQTPKERE